VRTRLISAPVPRSAVAQAIAVLGREASADLVAELSGLSPEDAARAHDALVAFEVLLPGTQIAFVHPIVRAAVYHDMGSAQRGAAHARAARIFFGALAGVAFSGIRVPNASAIICPPPEYHCDCPSINGLFYRWCCSPRLLQTRSSLPQGQVSEVPAEDQGVRRHPLLRAERDVLQR
jgi:hypothetical protein